MDKFKEISQTQARNAVTTGQELEKVRVIGIYAHIDAGKTTTSEAILYLTGRIHRAGSVDDGNTQLDWMEQERERGITITAAATTCLWNGNQIQLIDTPGHIDFTAEVMRSIRVIDSAVIVLCGVGGVETQTETVWRHADHQNLPRLVFINKLDRDIADFNLALASLQKRLAPHAVAIQIPIGSGEDFSGTIDLLEQKALFWGPGSNDPTENRIPLDLAEKANQAREVLMDAICETNDNLLRQRLEGAELKLEQVKKALRSATISGQLVPVLCGSARRRIGIQPLLDAINAYLPNPIDRTFVSGIVPRTQEPVHRRPAVDEPFCANVFKIVTDPHIGHLVWVRVFSGFKKLGETLFNPRTGENQRIGRIYHIHANRRERVDTMKPGDVVGLVGIKSVITGDTLCQADSPIILQPFIFPEPVISVALAPKTDEEKGKLHLYATHLCEEDPTLQLGFDPETSEQVLSGMGELHLEIAIDRLRSEYGLSVKSSPLRVAYRETIQRKSEATGIYRRQTGGHGHFAIVRLRIEPQSRGKGVLFHNEANTIEVPDQYARATEAGVQEALVKGILAGFPVTDVRVTLVGGKFHEIDSDSMDFRIAGSMAVRQALRQASPILLEPVMMAEIHVEEDYLGAVLGDFSRRRGIISEIIVHGSQRNILGDVPLAEVRGYATNLRDLTQGRGSFTLEFRRYEGVPERQANEVIEQRITGGNLPRR